MSGSSIGEVTALVSGDAAVMVPVGAVAQPSRPPSDCSNDCPLRTALHTAHCALTLPSPRLVHAHGRSHTCRLRSQYWGSVVCFWLQPIEITALC